MTCHNLSSAIFGGNLEGSAEVCIVGYSLYLAYADRVNAPVSGKCEHTKFSVLMTRADISEPDNKC